MVFRFLISQNRKLLPHPEPVEHKHFLSMSDLLVLMMVVALLKCLVTSMLGRGAQTKRGLCLQSNMCIFCCSKYLLSLILPGGRGGNPIFWISASWLLSCSCNTFSRFAQLTIVFDLERKMNSTLSNYTMFNWKLNSADFCFPLKQ